MWDNARSSGILRGVQPIPLRSTIQPVTEAPKVEDRQRFSVDIKGLLEALTEQFPEPLLCVRELVQNAADAGAHRIEVETSYDSRRGMFRLQVLDDGRGMNAAEVDGYLTIGFSEKEAGKERGRFGVGKLSPYALDIVRMVVETSDGQISHRITFNRDGSGQIAKPETRARGTVVRVYKSCARGEAEKLTARCFELVAERCGSINIPLFVNGERVNRLAGLPTPYAWSFHSSDGDGVLGITAESVRELMGGGIVLETGAPILGEDVSYILDSPRLSPTLSRNAVRRDHAFDAILRAAQGALPTFVEKVAGQLAERVSELRQQAGSVERGLDPNDRAALEWLRSQLLLRDDEEPPFGVQRAPVLETADGGLVSALELREVIRREGRVPASRIPRTRDELSAYADRGVPVLLLYRDLEDFLERQGIQTVEVDGADDGLEIEPGRYSAGEHALAHRPPISALKPDRRKTVFVLAGAAALFLAVVAVERDAEPPVSAAASAQRSVAVPEPDQIVAILAAPSKRVSDRPHAAEQAPRSDRDRRLSGGRAGPLRSARRGDGSGRVRSSLPQQARVARFGRRRADHGRGEPRAPLRRAAPGLLPSDRLLRGPRLVDPLLRAALTRRLRGDHGLPRAGPGAADPFGRAPRPRPHRDRLRRSALCSGRAPRRPHPPAPRAARAAQPKPPDRAGSHRRCQPRTAARAGLARSALGHRPRSRPRDGSAPSGVGSLGARGAEPARGLTRAWLRVRAR
jgi:hypothetical protein